MKLKYIANQLTPEDLDEVQRILLAYHLGQHVALSGPPGVGKTHLVEQIPKIVARPLFDITCDSYMTEAPLVGYPELTGENGHTITIWKSGEAARAAEENGIFYGDEFDLLPGSVQKRLNSLFDDRRKIKRRDGKEIPAGDNFMGIVSYNPSDRMSKRELEEAVADRFVHLAFDYLPPRLEAGIALEETAGLSLEERAVIVSDEMLRFLMKDGKLWKDQFTGERITHMDNAVVYDVFKRSGQNILPQKLAKKDLGNKLADYFVSVRSFSDHGTNKLPDDIKHYLRDIGEVTHVQLHKPSTRIIKSTISQYNLLSEMGMKPEEAQSYATRLCIDQIGYGKFGLQHLGKGTVYDALTSLAQFYGLLGAPRQRTDFRS